MFIIKFINRTVEKRQTRLTWGDGQFHVVKVPWCLGNHLDSEPESNRKNMTE